MPKLGRKSVEKRRHTATTSRRIASIPVIALQDSAVADLRRKPLAHQQ
jgi:hypothetical protein